MWRTIGHMNPPDRFPDLHERVMRCVTALTHGDPTAAPTSGWTLSTRLHHDLGFDSLDLVEVVMELEDEFQIVILDEAFEDARTIGDLVRVVEGAERA